MGSIMKRYLTLVIILTATSILFYINLLNNDDPVPVAGISPEQLLNLTAAYYPRLYTSFSYIHNHPSLCNTEDGGGDGGGAITQPPLTVLIMVTSSPDNFRERAVIRRTWGTAAHRADMSVVFLLGSTQADEIQKRIDAEDVLHGDILQEDFLDTFRNLTLKSVMMLRWVMESCEPLPLFVLKIDDDCFLNPNNLLTFAASRRGQPANESSPTKLSIYGDVFNAHPVLPQRDLDNKWYMSESEYPGETFPDFTSGSSYLIDGDAVPALYQAALTIPLLSLEDVFVSGLCAAQAGVVNVDVDEFSRDPRPYPCEARRHISYHEVPSNEMHLLWYLVNDRRFNEACKGNTFKNIDLDKVFRHMIEDNGYP